MSTTDETRAQGDGADAGPPPKRQPGWVKPAKRYGPIVVVIALIGAAVLVFGGGGDDGGDDEAATGGATATEDELIASGPMTWQKAEQEGETANIEWGPNCDTETGKIKLVSVYAAAVRGAVRGRQRRRHLARGHGRHGQGRGVHRRPGSRPAHRRDRGGGGGRRQPRVRRPNGPGLRRPLQQAVRDLRPDRSRSRPTSAPGPTTIGRRPGPTPSPSPRRSPFIVIGGPQQAAPVFSTELASRGIICAGTCGTAIPQAIVDEYAPYIWQNGPTPDQAAALAAEMIGKLAGPGKAELAGDDATRAEDRVYGLLHYDNPDGDHEPVFEAFTDQLADNGIELATDIEFTLDLARAQENARTNIARLKEAGVTTIIYYGDPLTPGSLTKEATAQDYHPEWIMGPTFLMDTVAVRPADRHAAVEERLRHLADPGPGRPGDQRRLPHLGLGVRGPAAQQQRQPAQPWDAAHRVPGHPAGRARADARDVPRRAPALPTVRRRADRCPRCRAATTASGPTPTSGGWDDATIVWFDPTAERRGRGRQRRGRPCTATPTAPSATRWATSPTRSTRPACSTTGRR